MRFLSLLTAHAVVIHLQPIGSAPRLIKQKFRLPTDRRFGAIVMFLRKKLGTKEHESVYCYIGNVFAPALDEGVGNLWSVSAVSSLSLGFFSCLNWGSGRA